MDSVTHIVLGACVGEALAGKKLGKQAVLWGAVANSIPDIDVLSSMWMSQVDSLLAHRGFTHSIMFAVLFTPLISFFFSRWHVNKLMLFKDWCVLFGSGVFIHIFIDALTSYGTGWFEPFSHYRVSMNVLFVADPFYTITLLISFIALLIIPSRRKSRKNWMRFGLITSTLYIVYAFVNKINVDSKFRNELTRENIVYSDYFSTPAPLNNFLWYLAAKKDTGYYIGYYSVFDRSDTIDLHFRPQNEKYLSTLSQNNDLLTLKRFSNDFYAADISGDTIYFSDIRFGTVNGWQDPNNDFVFRYCINKNADNDLVIQKGRFKSVNKAALVSLWERVCGR